MKVIGYENGQQIKRSLEDLEYIELDIVKDFVRQFESQETNPDARIEVDFSDYQYPAYKLVNCNEHFKKIFYNNFKHKEKAKVIA